MSRVLYQKSLQKCIATSIADQGGKASMTDILTRTGFSSPVASEICRSMAIAGYLNLIHSDIHIRYELTAEGWVLTKPERNLKQVQKSRLAALERLSPRERRSLMQAAFS